MVTCSWLCSCQGFQSRVEQPSLLLPSEQRESSTLHDDPVPSLLCGLTRAAWGWSCTMSLHTMLLAANPKATASLSACQNRDKRGALDPI